MIQGFDSSLKARTAIHLILKRFSMSPVAEMAQVVRVIVDEYVYYYIPSGVGGSAIVVSESPYDFDMSRIKISDMENPVANDIRDLLSRIIH